jgi:TPR repeat protein
MTTPLREKNAPYYQARELLKRGKYQEAYAIYHSLAQEGDANCQVFVGWMLYEGCGVEKNQSMAFGWFQRAASVGSANGAFCCGKYLLSQRRYADAIPYLRNAARTDYSPALLALGLCHIDGRGEERNIEKGLRLIEDAARLGNWMAKRQLAGFRIAGHYGFLGFVLGLLSLPYVIMGGLASLAIHGQTDRLTG